MTDPIWSSLFVSHANAFREKGRDGNKQQAAQRRSQRKPVQSVPGSGPIQPVRNRKHLSFRLRLTEECASVFAPVECQTMTWKKRKKKKRQTLRRENDGKFNDMTSEMFFSILRMKRYFIDALREILWWLR